MVRNIRQHPFHPAIQVTRSGVTALVIATLLMTMAVPDIDHHLNSAAAPQTAAYSCDAHGSAGAQSDTGENNHHCLVCPNSSQKISSPTAHVFVYSLLLFSIISVASTDHHHQLVDLNNSGKRSPPLV